MSTIQEIPYNSVFHKTPKKDKTTVKDYLNNIKKIIYKSYKKDISVRTLERHYSKFRSQIFKEELNYTTDIQISNKRFMHIVLPDVHVPFENELILNGILELLGEYQDKIASFTILGDFIDGLGFSKHNLNQVPLKDYSMGIEYKKGNFWLNKFDMFLDPEVEKNFLYGNHEDRYTRFMSDINNSVLNGAVKSPEEALNLKERGYNVKTNWKNDYFRIVDIDIFHGQYVNEYATKTHIMKNKGNVMFGHTHRVATLNTGQFKGYNIGFLGDILSPGFDYVSRFEKGDWRNAFSIISKINNKSVVTVIECVDNKFAFGGKIYG